MSLVWSVDFTDEAKKAFCKIATAEQRRITAFILERLETSGDPRRLAKPLHGVRSGLWRWRVGHYRLVGRLERSVLVILIVDIDHRRQVYR